MEIEKEGMATFTNLNIVFGYLVVKIRTFLNFYFRRAPPPLQQNRSGDQETFFLHRVASKNLTSNYFFRFLDYTGLPVISGKHR